jgi:SPP1 gp7 family putative phage head morphogenesis protein
MNKRQKELAQLSLDAEKAVLDELEKEYKRALNDINKKILQFSGMIERLENAIDSTTDEAQKEILISQRQSKVYQKQYQEALQGQISGILDKMQGDEYATIEQYLKECYEDAYIGTLYDLQGQGIPLIMPIDQAAAVKAITTDSKISKSLYTALGVDVAKLKKTISSEITRGIASSRPYAEIARNLSTAAEIPKNRAKLITRTEGHRIQSASNYNACVDAKAKGADVVKQWSAALDARTRPSHRALDGQIVEVDEPFSLGNKKAMFPGDFGDPAEDCNCRCRVNQRARWALNSTETKMLGNTDKMTDEDLKPIAEKLSIPVDELRKYSGQIIPVRAKNYEDFKRQYNKIWNYDNRENYTGDL